MRTEPPTSAHLIKGLLPATSKRRPFGSSAEELHFLQRLDCITVALFSMSLGVSLSKRAVIRLWQLISGAPGDQAGSRFPEHRLTDHARRRLHGQLPRNES